MPKGLVFQATTYYLLLRDPLLIAQSEERENASSPLCAHQDSNLGPSP